MKLKKKQFARLKEIAQLLDAKPSLAGTLINNLISDIESVQKPKAIQEKPLSWSGMFNGAYTDLVMKDTEENREILENLVKKNGGTISDTIIGDCFAKHRKDVEDNIQKELDATPIHQAIKSGLKKQREAILDLLKYWKETIGS